MTSQPDTPMITYDGEANIYHIDGDKFFQALAIKYPPPEATPPKQPKSNPQATSTAKAAIAQPAEATAPVEAKPYPSLAEFAEVAEDALGTPAEAYLRRRAPYLKQGWLPPCAYWLPARRLAYASGGDITAAASVSKSAGG